MSSSTIFEAGIPQFSIGFEDDAEVDLTNNSDKDEADTDNDLVPEESIKTNIRTNLVNSFSSTN